jgi:hypothetical protein
MLREDISCPYCYPFLHKIIICSRLCFFRKYGLSDDTVDFIGHALALHRDDRHLNEPALDTVKRMKVSLDKSSARWSLLVIQVLLSIIHNPIPVIVLPFRCAIFFGCALFTDFSYIYHHLLLVIFRVSCTFSRGITIYLSVIWAG